MHICIKDRAFYISSRVTLNLLYNFILLVYIIRILLWVCCIYFLNSEAPCLTLLYIAWKHVNLSLIMIKGLKFLIRVAFCSIYFWVTYHIIGSSLSLHFEHYQYKFAYPLLSVFVMLIDYLIIQFLDLDFLIT